MMMIPHQPLHWVAGILKNDVWIGQFSATPEEMLKWCEEENYDPDVWGLVMELCDCQAVYADWWERLSGKT